MAQQGAAAGAASTASAKKGDKKEEPQYGAPSYDLAALAALYSGRGLIHRLKFLGEHCKELHEAALKKAAALLRETRDTALYQEVCKGSGVAPDAQWVSSTERNNSLTQEKMEMELNGFKTSMQKDNIRTGQNDLGDFHVARGDLNSALKSYVRTRDYCANAEQIVDMCMRVIRVSLEMGNFPHCLSYVAKAEQQDVTDARVSAQLKAASALCQLASRKYAAAALKFMEVAPDLGTSFNEFVAPQDVALYGGLCALAAFDRQELKSKVLDSDGPFQAFLALFPEMREIMACFYGTQYGRCFKLLGALANNVYLDVFLNPHAATLLRDIRRKALMQYFSPYDTVDMRRMAEAFETSVDKLEAELAELIMDGYISARIDSSQKVLYARASDLRDEAFAATLSTGEKFAEETVDTMRRMEMLRHEFHVRPPPKGQAVTSLMANMMQMFR